MPARQVPGDGNEGNSEAVTRQPKLPPQLWSGSDRHDAPLDAPASGKARRPYWSESQETCLSRSFLHAGGVHHMIEDFLAW